MLEIAVLIHKISLYILACSLCSHIACKHTLFLSACTSRYCQRLILLQHVKPSDLTQMKKKSPNSAVVPIVNITAGELLSAVSRLMFF